MASHVSGTHPGAAVRSSERTGIGSGWVVFAGVMMIFGGLMTLFAGIAAIANDEVFAATRNYVFEFDLTGWGWVHLVMGVVITLAGAALFQGATWARVVGVGLAGLAMLANFLWLPYAPFWAIVLIAINAFVIWALCTAPSPER
ncbi:DUF7144 family membrane protein [Streptomyces boluensis]|uniref:DUF7144 domain-containing protein n=1 Tax=Streptomyces boluensis TaxID=1775135 RepID=A0A964UUJ9_9ACTN|nr:hypothetical protein [Streptomyces boluensis]NBE53177.1 hypothetical protein [Streptomyces boluensis]